MHKVDASPNWTHTVSLPSSWPLDPTLLCCWHLDIQTSEADTPTLPCNTHALASRDAQVLSHPELALGDPLSPLLPGRFTYSPGGLA